MTKIDANALRSMITRIEELEADVKRFHKNEGRYTPTALLHPSSTNLSNIREMFLLEILRENGLLQGINLDAIAAKVSAQLAGDDIPWGATQKTALRHIEVVKHEIAGEYGWEPPEYSGKD